MGIKKELLLILLLTISMTLRLNAQKTVQTKLNEFNTDIETYLDICAKRHIKHPLVSFDQLDTVCSEIVMHSSGDYELTISLDCTDLYADVVSNLQKYKAEHNHWKRLALFDIYSYMYLILIKQPDSDLLPDLQKRLIKECLFLVHSTAHYSMIEDFRKSDFDQEAIRTVKELLTFKLRDDQVTERIERCLYYINEWEISVPDTSKINSKRILKYATKRLNRMTLNGTRPAQVYIDSIKQARRDQCLQQDTFVYGQAKQLFSMVGELKIKACIPELEKSYYSDVFDKEEKYRAAFALAQMQHKTFEDTIIKQLKKVAAKPGRTIHRQILSLGSPKGFILLSDYLITDKTYPCGTSIDDKTVNYGYYVLFLLMNYINDFPYQLPKAEQRKQDEMLFILNGPYMSNFHCDIITYFPDNVLQDAQKWMRENADKIEIINKR